MAKKSMGLYDAMSYMLGVGNPSGLDRQVRLKMLSGLNSPYTAGRSGGSGSGGGRPGTGTGTPAPAAQPLNWTFPQYSQTWAFTPPTPPPYMPPPAFDPKSKTGYAAPPKTTTPRPTTGTTTGTRSTWQRPSGGAFSFADLLNKYGR